MNMPRNQVEPTAPNAEPETRKIEGYCFEQRYVNSDEVSFWTFTSATEPPVNEAGKPETGYQWAVLFVGTEDKRPIVPELIAPTLLEQNTELLEALKELHAELSAMGEPDETVSKEANKAFLKMMKRARAIISKCEAQNA